MLSASSKTAMNVLVYSGAGVSPVSLAHTLASLRALLPTYAVAPITASALASQPWAPTCALLVIPGGRDNPYIASLGPAVSHIKDFVHGGGAFFGLCAGAYFSSKRVEWELGTPLEEVGDRPLGFFPGVCKGCVYGGFTYTGEEGARAVALSVGSEDSQYKGLYYNGGGEFVGADDMGAQGVRPFARYVDDEGKGRVAAVDCSIGQGRAFLSSVHIEYPLTREPLLSALRKRYPDLTEDRRKEMEAQRWELLGSALGLLGLRTCRSVHSLRPTRSLPQFLASPPTRPHLSTFVLSRLQPHCTGSSPYVLKDTVDTFHFHSSSSTSDLLREARSLCDNPDPKDVDAAEAKHVIICDGTSLPTRENTPHFDLGQYFTELSEARAHAPTFAPGLTSSVNELWRLGDVLTYGECVSSTQSLLEKNPTLMSSIPSPLVSLATFQLSGRGRGSNAWVSPEGCLLFSILLRPPPAIRATSLVFIQYLFGLAVVEACRDLMGKAGESLRLKWPNDIYAVTRDEEGGGEVMRKVGGVLVNTSFSGGKIDVIIGTGLNVRNPEPTTCLSELVPREMASSLTLERVVARILVVFDNMWDVFVLNRGSFAPFMDLYLERWLHSDQLVTLTTVNPPLPVRIVGITPDHGLLRTVAASGPATTRVEYIDLQPDGNSFDMLAGLIKTKL